MFRAAHSHNPTQYSHIVGYNIHPTFMLILGLGTLASKCEINKIEVNTLMTDEKIKNSNELEFVVFCIENVAEKLGVGAERVYQAFTEKSDILNGYIVPEYEVLHTQSREYIIDDLLDVMKERGVEV